MTENQILIDKITRAHEIIDEHLKCIVDSIQTIASKDGHETAITVLTNATVMLFETTKKACDQLDMHGELSVLSFKRVVSEMRRFFDDKEFDKQTIH